MRNGDLVQSKKYDGVYIFDRGEKGKNFYASFSHDGTRYQKINFTKKYNCDTEKKTYNKILEVKGLLSIGEDPFGKNFGQDKIRDIVLDKIQNKVSEHRGKDNTPHKKNLESFYMKHVDPVIGHLKINKVEKKHIDIILKNIGHLAIDRQKLLSVLLKKEFEDKFRSREIKANPLYEVNYGKKEWKDSLKTRMQDKVDVAILKLFKTIMESTTKQKLLYLMSIMTVRRVGELHQLKYKDFHKDENGNYYVKTRPETTKTSLKESYPIPEEVVAMLPINIFDRKFRETNLFSFCRNTIYTNYPRLVEKTGINFHYNPKLEYKMNINNIDDDRLTIEDKKRLKKGLEVNCKYTITTHDNRKLFISLMAKKGFDTEFLDACLSHNQKKEIKNHYFEVDDETKEHIFNEYWKYLRTYTDFDFKI